MPIEINPMASPRRRGRRPRLKVVGGEPIPRHRVPFSLFKGAHNYSIEVWTMQEWAALPEADRPGHATWLPGIGWLAVGGVDALEFDEIRDEHAAALAAHDFMRGLGR